MPFYQFNFGLILGCLLLLCGQAEAEARAPHKDHVTKPMPAVSTRQEVGEHTEDLRALMLQLYRTNPEELAKSTQVGAREMTEWVFDGKANWKFDEVRGLQRSEAIDLALDPGFAGDRVLALIVGLETLVFGGYGGVNEYAIPSRRDEERLGQLYCQLYGVQQRLTTVPEFLRARQDVRPHITAVLEGMLRRLFARMPGVNQPACM